MKTTRGTRLTRNKAKHSVKDCLGVKFTNEDLKVHPVLKNYFGYCFYKAAMRFKVMMDERTSQHGITTTQLGILRILEDVGGMAQNTLGNGMGIDKASMAKWIDQLDQMKLVSRIEHSADRRVKTVTITKKGTALVNRLAESRKLIETQFLVRLSAEEQAVIRSAIPKLLG